MAFLYRRATVADVPVMAHLPQKGEAGGDPEDRMIRYLEGEHHPQQALMPRAMWVAEMDGSAIGYTAGHLTRRFDCDGELQWIYVVREHRRNHVASELLKLLAQWFVDRRALRVCVNVGDEAARPFYFRHGATDLRAHWMVWDDISLVLADAGARAPVDPWA